MPKNFPERRDAEYVRNWHQGATIWVISPVSTKIMCILGNHISIAAQKIDIHSNHVIVASNIVENAFMGMRAMHGSRNGLITGKQFFGNGLWNVGNAVA